MITLTTKQVSEIQLALRLHKESKQKLARINRGNKNGSWYDGDTAYIETIESLLTDLVLEVMASPNLSASLEVKL